ncbi:TPA: hypothetical protein ACSTJY_005001 [Serratia fonticola]
MMVEQFNLNREDEFFARYCVIERWVSITSSDVVRVVFDLINCADEIELYKIAICVAIKNGDKSFEVSFPELSFQ